MPKQGQVLIDAQAGKKSDVAMHLRFQNVILSSFGGWRGIKRKMPKFLKGKNFDRDGKFYYGFGWHLSHSVKYRNFNSIILVCKILKIQYNAA